jgi:hypothetical protein
MSDRFAAVPRGQALSGSRAIAEYILGDADKSDTVVALPREEFGFIKLGRELVGYTGWIDFARSRFLKCFDNLEEINEWRRKNVPPDRLLKLNYPPTVLSHWESCNTTSITA